MIQTKYLSEMGKRVLVIASVLMLTVVGIACVQSKPDFSESSKEDGALVRLIMGVLDGQHYEPIKINDKFSQRAFDAFLKNLDTYKRYLIASDVESLKKYRNKIDDEIEEMSFPLLDEANKIIEKRTKDTEGFIEDVLKHPFDFSKKETVEFDEDKLTYCESKSDLKERWRKVLKYQVLSRIDNKEALLKKQKEKADTAYKAMTFAEIEIEAREGVQKSYKDLYQRLNQLDYEDRKRVFINSFVELFDPHTSYFPPKDKEDFDIGMSGQLEGIGATLSVKDGYVKVMSIVPGSASWKQGDLKEGDLILKVAQKDDAPVDIVNMRLDEAIRLIRGKKGTEVRLTVKKLDGEVQVVPIIRDVVVIEAGFAKSSIISQEGKKLGLIHLPKFYADFGKINGRSCAADIAKEVKKLKKNKVDGILIDLRNNGGGSLQDVVEMVGYFIPSGPVVQVKQRHRPAYGMRDDDDGKTIYDGPLLVMVNEYSASASEIFAAAIKDYKRGVIIGSKSTFGKGTVQRFIDLNQFAQGGQGLGAIKLTTQKFYRINGESTQLKGVEPHIVLPDAYMNFDLGERELNEALKWDEITPKIYREWDKQPDFTSLIEQSKSRLGESQDYFSTMEKYAEWLKEKSDDNLYHLDTSAFHAENDKYEKEAEQFDAINDYKSDLEIDLMLVDPVTEKDSADYTRYEAWGKKVQKDPYINESFQVFLNMIE
jgi:carboxyl-terminal processing protease